MSQETMRDLNNNTLIGYTEKRGTAWHYRASEQGDEPNHYPGPIPVEDVRRRLFPWKAVEGALTTTILTEDGVETITDETRKVIVRPDTGTILGVFKEGYTVHQYDEWLIRNVESLLDSDLAVGSAGLLKGGAVAWVQIEMADTLTVEGVDFRPFLTAATSMDGSLATTYQQGAQVVVCDNTLSAAMLENTSRIRIKHSARSLGRLGEARDALGIVHATADAFADAVRELTAREVSPGDWRKFLYAFSPDDEQATDRVRRYAGEKRDQLDRLWRWDPRVSPWSGTGYGVVAAVNTWTHHEQWARGGTRVDRNTQRMVTGKVDELDRSSVALLDRVQLV